MRDDVYKTYVTDALRVLTENTAQMSGGKHLSIRYYDVIHPAPDETRTEDEIITSIFSKIVEEGGE